VGAHGIGQRPVTIENQRPNHCRLTSKVAVRRPETNATFTEFAALS
jgi:hypothetical protein